MDTLSVQVSTSRLVEASGLQAGTNFNLQPFLPVDKKIARLDVPVYHVVVVDALQRNKQIFHVVPHFFHAHLSHVVLEIQTDKALCTTCREIPACVSAKSCK